MRGQHLISRYKRWYINPFAYDFATPVKTVHSFNPWRNITGRHADISNK